jgi:flagellar biosynthesis anti-sigma factor FlgM
MTNTISPLSNTPPPTETSVGVSGGANVSTNMSTSAAQPGPASQTSDSSAASPSEAVTLSAAAQTTTQLLTAARNADGFNQTAVDQIRGALQAGTYNVAPEDLAQAIATVLKESN